MPSESRAKKACCLVSELLEETGIDRETIRTVRRQVLQGMIMLCQWQLDRMERPARSDDEKERPGRARKVVLD
jgi:hypothetical protein